MRVAIAAIRRRLIKENPDSTLESKKIKTPAAAIMVSLLRVATLTEKYVAKEIRINIIPTISGDSGTNVEIPRPTRSHRTSGRIRC